MSGIPGLTAPATKGERQVRERGGGIPGLTAPSSRREERESREDGVVGQVIKNIGNDLKVQAGNQFLEAWTILSRRPGKNESGDDGIGEKKEKNSRGDGVGKKIVKRIFELGRGAATRAIESGRRKKALKGDNNQKALQAGEGGGDDEDVVVGEFREVPGGGENG